MTAAARPAPSIEQRYRLVPQMRTYDRLLEVLAPYLTFVTKPGYRSEIANTDARGFRWSSRGSAMIDSYTWWESPRPKGIVLGGSFTFGVGASADGATLVSKLNQMTAVSFLNLGIRGGNSTQEMIASIPFLEECDWIVICSGINNLVVNLQAVGGNELYGPFYGEGAHRVFCEFNLSELAARIEGAIDRVGFSTLFREYLRRAGGRLSPRRSSTASHAPSRDLSARVRRAVRLQIRDLHVIASAAPKQTKLLFAVQPFAGTCPHEPTSEERKLFGITDALQGKQWEELKAALAQYWPEYAREIADACTARGITFLDCNKLSFDGWSFVDRVHMTDRGYESVARHLAKEIS